MKGQFMSKQEVPFFQVHPVRQGNRKNKNNVCAYILAIVLIVATCGFVQTQANTSEYREMKNSLTVQEDQEKIEDENSFIPVAKATKATGKDWKVFLVSTNMKDAIPHIETASEKYNVSPWQIIGIASAESSIHKNYGLAYDKQHCHNPWGILNVKKIRNDGSRLRCYHSWGYSCDDMARILRSFYLNEGKNSPEKMVRKYVGEKDSSWIRAVSEYWQG